MPRPLTARGFATGGCGMFQLPLVARNQVFCYNKARKNVKEVVPVKLNEKILYYRKAARLSQEELAARVGVSRQAVSKWELGDATPEVDKLLALAKVFGVTTDELLSEAEPAKVQGEAPPQGQPAAHTVPTASSVDPFDKATGFLGRMVQRYGWIFGVRIALSGLGLTIIGVLARWGFGAMFQTSQSMMSGIGGFGGMGGVTFSGDVPPGLQQEILGELGYATASPLGGMEGFFLGFATVLLVLGVLTMIAGAALAAYLYQKGNKKS